MYMASIHRLEHEDKWLKQEGGGQVEHTTDESERLVFWDETDAEATLVYLNDTFPDCYVLTVEEEGAEGDE